MSRVSPELWIGLAVAVVPASIAGIVAWVTTRATIKGSQESVTQAARIELARDHLDRHQRFFAGYLAKLQRMRDPIHETDFERRMARLYELSQAVTEERASATVWLSPELTSAMLAAEMAAFLIISSQADPEVHRYEKNVWTQDNAEKQEALSKLIRARTSELEAAARGEQ